MRKAMVGEHIGPGPSAVTLLMSFRSTSILVLLSTPKELPDTMQCEVAVDGGPRVGVGVGVELHAVEFS